MKKRAEGLADGNEKAFFLFVVVLVSFIFFKLRNLHDQRLNPRAHTQMKIHSKAFIVIAQLTTQKHQPKNINYKSNGAPERFVVPTKFYFIIKIELRAN